MKICLVTYYAVTNIGDKILTDVVSWMLKKNGHDVRIVDINARHPYKFRGFFGRIEKEFCKHFVHRDSFEARSSYFAKNIKGADYILFGGGQIIEPQKSAVNENIGIITRIAENRHIFIAYNAIGFSKINSAGTDVCEELVASMSSRQICYFSSREQIPKFIESRIRGTGAVVKMVCDSAVWVCEAYGMAKKAPCDVKVIGINVIYAEAFNRLYNSIPSEDVVAWYVRLYNTLTGLGYQCRFFTNGVGLDAMTLDRIIKKLGRGYACVERSAIDRDGKSFVEMLRGFDFIISSRLHTSICSYSVGVPSIAVSWDAKILEFYRQIGSPGNVLDVRRIYDRTSLELLIQKAVGMYADVKCYDDYRNSIVNSIPGLI